MTTMDKFHFDIIMRIFDALWCTVPDEDKTPDWAPAVTFKSTIAPYALISRSWQHTVETQLFKNIRVRNYELEKFASLFTDPARRRLLRTLTLHSHCQNYVGYTFPHTGSKRWHRAAGQQLLRTTTKQFLSILRSWEESPSDAVGLRYSLILELTNGRDNWPLIKLQEPVDTTSLGSTNYFKRFGPGDLDGCPIAAVSALKVFCGDLHPSAPCGLAGLFPNLERWEFMVEDMALNLQDKRAEHRLALARGLTGLVGKLPKLACLKVRGSMCPPDNHSFECQSFVDIQGIDELSEAIRKLAQPTVRILSLKDNLMLSVDLFSDTRTDNSSDTWPALQELDLGLCCVTPDGRWMFTGDPDEADELYEVDEDHLDDDDSDASDDVRMWSGPGKPSRFLWRNTVDPKTFGGMAQTLTDAIAAGRMPRLRKACLNVDCCQYSALVEYLEAGETRRSGGCLGDKVAARTLALDIHGYGVEGLEGLTSSWREWLGRDCVVEVNVTDPGLEEARSDHSLSTDS